MSSTSLANAEPEQNSAHSYYALGIVLLAYILSFIDRNIMAVLIGPIRHDFDISDFQYSLLHGFAFSMFYIILGLPIGRLADRYSRRWIVTIGVLAWSVMTCVCGIATKFKWLFVARIGVGVGEAALSPPVYSLLSDYFSADKLPRVMAVYTLGITIGGGLAYMVGGAIYEYFAAWESLDFPIIGEVRPWQMTFFVVGVPGVVVALLMTTIKEPRRRGMIASKQSAAIESLPVAEVGRYMKGHWQAYVAIGVGASLLAILGNGTMAWYTEYLIRSHDMDRASAGAMFGLIFITAGSLGTLAGGWSVKPLMDRGYRDANMRVMMLVGILWVVPAVAGPLMPTQTLALLAAIPIVFFLNSYFGVCVAAVQLVTPNQMRAQLSALLLFMTNLFGLALGPTIIASVTDFVFQDDQALRYSLAIIPAIVCPCSAILVAWGLKYYRRAMDDAELWQE